MITYLLLWFPLLILAVANGLVRDLAYARHVGTQRAHRLSTYSLLALFAAYIAWVNAQFPPDSYSEAWLIGATWTTLTLVFEFGFGRYRGNSWTTLLAEYAIWRGRVWILIPLFLLLAPPLFYRLAH